MQNDEFNKTVQMLATYEKVNVHYGHLNYKLIIFKRRKIIKCVKFYLLLSG